MFIAIRIKGMVKIPTSIQETLFRMRLRRKYSAIFLEETAENKKLLEKVRNFISYGIIEKSILSELIKERGQGKKQEELKFLRLHPPRGGIDSKKHSGVGKGVLGQNKNINELVRRML
jgi:large subunit ribosomal protein L30